MGNNEIFIFSFHHSIPYSAFLIFAASFLSSSCPQRRLYLPVVFGSIFSRMLTEETLNLLTKDHLI